MGLRMNGVVVGCGLLFLFFLINNVNAQSTKARKGGPYLVVQHSLDGGDTWVEKGKLIVKTSSSQTDVYFQPRFNTWEEEPLNALVELGKKGELYKVRIGTKTINEEEQNAGAGEGEEGWVQVALAPCALFNSLLQEDYVVHLNAEGSIVGVRHAMRRRAAPKNYCGLYNVLSDKVGEDTSTATRVSLRVFPQPVKHKVVITQSQAARAETYQYSFVAPSFVENGRPLIGSGVEVRSPRDPAQQKPVVEEKSFLQKYWMWILVGFVVLSMSSGAGAPEPQAGAQGAAAPAPAAVGARRK